MFKIGNYVVLKNDYNFKGKIVARTVDWGVAIYTIELANGNYVTIRQYSDLPKDLILI